jgi:hypothetical protein
VNIARSVYRLGSKVDFCRHSCLQHVNWLVLNTAKDFCSIGRNIYKPQLHELHHANNVNYLSLLNHKNKFVILRYLSSLNPPKVGGYCWLIVLLLCWMHCPFCEVCVWYQEHFGIWQHFHGKGVLILIFVLCFISHDHSDNPCSYVPIFIILVYVHNLPHIPIIIID